MAITNIGTELSRASTALDLASNALTAELTKIDNALRVLGLGVEASLPLTDGYTLMFGRYQGNLWALSVYHGTKKWKLVDAPRFIRVNAVDVLPDLVKQLYENSKVLAVALENATIKARDANSAIDKLQAELDGAKLGLK